MPKKFYQTEFLNLQLAYTKGLNDTPLLHKYDKEATGFIPQINQWVFALRFYKKKLFIQLLVYNLLKCFIRLCADYNYSVDEESRRSCNSVFCAVIKVFLHYRFHFAAVQTAVEFACIQA